MIQESMNVCKICEQPKKEGIRLIHLFICTACELELLSTSPEEEKYQYFINQMKACSYQKQ